MSLISVIIPTRNREYLLKELIYRIATITKNDYDNNYEILIVDSSDYHREIDVPNGIQISHLKTEIRSAAIQRNLGMESINPKTDFIAFLDDDVIIGENYFNKLKESLLKYQAIGVSGIVRNKNGKFATAQNRIKNFLKRLVFLYSKQAGSLLISGVNIPITNPNQGVIKSEWLIGCSFWNYKKIKSLRFEGDFYGQSLGEDVIFSYKASRLGSLYVDTEEFITHLESDIGRQDYRSFIYQWLFYRNRLMDYRERNLKLRFSNTICTSAKLIQVICYLVKDPKKMQAGLLGFKDFFGSKIKNED